MKHAFEKAGLTKHQNDLELAAARYFNSGGTVEWFQSWAARVVAEMGKSGHVVSAQQGQPRSAALSRPTPSEGQARFIQQDCSTDAYARPPMLSADQNLYVHPADQNEDVPTERPLPEGRPTVVLQDQIGNADGQPIASGEAGPYLPKKAKDWVPPAREPSTAELKAMKEASDLTYFEMIKLRGKAWTQYRFKQLKNVRSLNFKENALIQEVIDYQRMHRIDDEKFISRSIPVSEMQKMVSRVDGAIFAKSQIMMRKAKKGKAARG